MSLQSAFERVARQALGRDGRSSKLDRQFVRHCNQRFGDAESFVPVDSNRDLSEARYCRRHKRDSLIVRAGEGARSFNELPLELRVLVETAPRTIARQCP
jgi:hypothetical protein